MVALARRNDLPWDAILGSEVARDFKPKPRVYLAACEAFDLPPGDCMMVAAHSNDLSHAAKCGLRTAHIARPNEHGPGKGEAAPKVPVDFAAEQPGRSGGEARRMTIASRPVVVTALGIAQILAWGTSFYFPAVLARRSSPTPAGRWAGSSAAYRSGC